MKTMKTISKSKNPLSFQPPVEDRCTRFVGIPHHKVDPALMIVRQAHSSLETEFRNAAANLLRGEKTSRIYVTSPRQGDGKTSTAFNLAWALADSARMVLLVELNFTKPHFRTALGNLKLRYGVENAMRGLVEPEDTVFSLESTGVHIAAVRNPTPIDKLEPLLEHLEAFLEWGSRNYEVMVIDCPPVISPDWKAWFSEFVGPSLLVVREDRTPLLEVKRAARLLGANLTGVLLNGERRDPVQLPTPVAPRNEAAEPVVAERVLRHGS